MRKKNLAILPILLIPFLSFAQQATYDVTPGNGNGVRFWQSDMYKIHMGNTSEYRYGPVTDYSIKNNMNTDPGRGWTWGIYGQTPILALSNGGHMQLAGTFTTTGNIVLPSNTGNKQIFTWAADDQNWRIGMSESPGFSRSIATGHVQYITYSGTAVQGFAVGVNGAQSSFEVRGDHQAFFRGKVGLGKTNPTAVLHILSPSANGADNSIIFEAPNIGPNISHGHHGTTGDWYLRSASSSGKVVLQDMGGNVGVGTSSPADQLEVVSGNKKIGFNSAIAGITNGGIISLSRTDGAKVLYLGTSNSTNDDPVIFGMGGSSEMRFVSAGGSSQGFGFYTNTTLPVAFGARASMPAAAMKITGDGKIGIGTTSPDQKLTVKGKIHAEEVIIDLSVPAPDYVFEQNYALTPLDEVQAYIAQNKHLPEVPSAKEMEKDGVKVGEMEMILLKKIEEMTLYMIEMKKINESQDATIKQLQTEVNQLKNK